MLEVNVSTVVAPLQLASVNDEAVDQGADVVRIVVGRAQTPAQSAVPWPASGFDTTDLLR